MLWLSLLLLLFLLLCIDTESSLRLVFVCVVGFAWIDELVEFVAIAATSSVTETFVSS